MILTNWIRINPCKSDVRLVDLNLYGITVRKSPVIIVILNPIKVRLIHEGRLIELVVNVSLVEREAVNGYPLIPNEFLVNAFRKGATNLPLKLDIAVVTPVPTIKYVRCNRKW